MPLKSDISIIKQVLNGDKEAFALLVDNYKDMIFTLCLNLLKNREQAEEVAQDVFVKAFSNLGKFKQKSKFSTWIYRIAYNECISHLRKKSPLLLNIEEFYQRQEYTESEDLYELTKEKRQGHLIKALSELPEDDRSIVMFHYFDDLSIVEIAEITGLSKSNVKIKLFRTRKKLHEILSPIFEKEIITG